MFKTKTQILAVIIISLSMVSAALADAPVKVAVRALSQKLKSDLAVANVNLKLNKVETWNVSKTEVRIKGAGAANDLLLNFDVKVDKVKDISTDVSYVFVNASAPTAVADTEDLLTRDLLNQLNKDYKTENIVISIDGYDTTQIGDAKNFKGTGDVRVGFESSRIEFDVTMDAKTNLVTNVKYQIKE